MALRRGKDRVSTTGSEELQLWHTVRQNLRTLEKIRLIALEKAANAESIREELVVLKERKETGDEYRTRKRKLDDLYADLAGKSKDELAAIESAQEKLGILVALRSSSDESMGSRTSAPRKDAINKVKSTSGPSQGAAAGSNPAPGTPTPLSRRTSTSVVPNSLNSGAAAGRGRRESLAAQHPLPEGRKVAVLPTRTNEEEDWLKATVLSYSKTVNQYTVQDDDDPGTEGTYKVGMDNILPLPISLPTLPASDYSPGLRVLAMYPDTSCFYHAVVRSGGPGLTRNSNIAKLLKKEAELLEAKYHLEFDDDGGEIRQVPAWLVVQAPGM